MSDEHEATRMKQRDEMRVVNTDIDTWELIASILNWKLFKSVAIKSKKVVCCWPRLIESTFHRRILVICKSTSIYGLAARFINGNFSSTKWLSRASPHKPTTQTNHPNSVSAFLRLCRCRSCAFRFAVGGRIDRLRQPSSVHLRRELSELHNKRSLSMLPPRVSLAHPIYGKTTQK